MARLDPCWPGVTCLAAGAGTAVAMRISGARAGLGAATAGAVASAALLPPIMKTGAGAIGSCEQAVRTPIATRAALGALRQIALPSAISFPSLAALPTSGSWPKTYAEAAPSPSAGAER
jgi:hypothetical protein